MSKDFQDHIARIAAARGVSGATTEEQLAALKQHADDAFTGMVIKPKRVKFRLLPAAEAGAQNTIEVRVPISQRALLDASVTEDRSVGREQRDPIDQLAQAIRGELSKLIAGQLMLGEYISVRREGGTVIATLTVTAPPAPEPAPEGG